MGTLDRVYSQNGYIKRDGAPDSLPAELFRMDEKLCFHIGIFSAFCTIIASGKRCVKHFRLFCLQNRTECAILPKFRTKLSYTPEDSEKVQFFAPKMRFFEKLG